MTIEQRAAVRQLLAEQQQLQRERNENARFNRENEEVIALLANRGKSDPCDTTRRVISLYPAPSREDAGAVDAMYEPVEDSRVTVDINWSAVLNGLVILASGVLATVMVMGWML